MKSGLFTLCDQIARAIKLFAIDLTRMHSSRMPVRNRMGGLPDRPPPPPGQRPHVKTLPSQTLFAGVKNGKKYWKSRGILLVRKVGTLTCCLALIVMYNWNCCSVNSFESNVAFSLLFVKCERGLRIIRRFQLLRYIANR